MTVDDMNQVMKLVQLFSDSFCYTIDMTTDEAWFNGGVEKKFAFPGSYIEHFTGAVERLCHKDDIPMLRKDLEACRTGKQNDHFLVYRWINRNDKNEWIECRGHCVDTSDGHRILIGRVREIGEKQRADNTTGLQREVRFQQKIQPILANNPCSIRYCIRFGVDHFKEINEKDGTEAGDGILREIAEFMTQAVEGHVDVYRLVADEFMIMVTADSEVPSPRTIYDRVTRKIVSAIRKRDYSRAYTISAGVLEKNFIGMTYEDVMNSTEFAMFQAKRNGRNQMVFFDQGDYNRYVTSLHIREMLQKSIKDDFKGFEVYYQPIVTRGGCRIEGAEALLRYHDENGNNISPAVMIPILEDSSMIIPVGKFVLENAARTCSEWRRKIPNFRINVNLSYVQIRQSRINAELRRVFSQYALSSGGLMMEVTESGYIQSDSRCKSLFAELGKMDVDVAIDDFGTGYSNLRYIRDMNASVVKIDRDFVVQALGDTYDFTVLKNIIKMVHEVGMQVCVEGVEKDEELHKLDVMNPDYIQGFLFGRPSPKDDFAVNFIV